jgi:exopolysaccharide biosynthesis polyprenyl glycosylphosphotransferase
VSPKWYNRGRRAPLLKYVRHQFNILCALADIGALVAAFVSAYFIRRDIVPHLAQSMARKPMFGVEYYFPVFLLTGLVMMGTLYATRAYRQNPGVPLSATFLINLKAVLIALLLTLALAYLLKMTFVSRGFLLTFMALFLVASTAAKHAAALWFRRSAQRGRGRRMVVLVGAGRSAYQLAQRILQRPELGLLVRGFMHVGDEAGEELKEMESLGLKDLGPAAELPGLLAREVIDGVLFAGEARTLAGLEELFLICEDLGVDSLMAANLFPHLVAQVELERLEDLPLLRFTTVPHNHLALFLKRSMDVVGAVAGLLFLSPLFALCAVLIKITSPGPVFFSQERMGLNGRRFFCHKFRTMVVDAEKRLAEVQHLNEVDGPVFKIKRDPRITRVGALLRKTSVDELPQLWNVLVGEMSLVGPRPPIPSEVEKYERWQRRRLSMRPGITCLWQISGRSDLDFDTWMRLDLRYIDNWSLTLDLIILLKTVPAVLSTRGAA